LNPEAPGGGSRPPEITAARGNPAKRLDFLDALRGIDGEYLEVFVTKKERANRIASSR